MQLIYRNIFLLIIFSATKLWANDVELVARIKTIHNFTDHTWHVYDDYNRWILPPHTNLQINFPLPTPNKDNHQIKTQLHAVAQSGNGQSFTGNIAYQRCDNRILCTSYLRFFYLDKLLPSDDQEVEIKKNASKVFINFIVHLQESLRDSDVQAKVTFRTKKKIRQN